MRNFSLLKRFAVLSTVLTLIVVLELVLVIFGVSRLEQLGETIYVREVPLLSKAHQIRFAVLNVQQWLTDISATRGQDGLNDGFDMAEESAQQFYQLINELKTIDPENAERYQAMVPIFDAYYSVGKEMARAYVAEGPQGGNVMMAQFDTAAENITDQVKAFVVEAERRAEHMGAQENEYLHIGGVSVTSGFLIILSVIAFVYWMMVRALRFLPEIVNEFNYLADGDLSRTHQVTESNCEVGQLSKGFVAMRVRLKDVISDVSVSSDQVQLAVEQMTEQTQETLRAIDNQRSDINMVASAMTEMSASADEVAHSAKMSAELAHEANQEANNGSQVVRSAMDVIEELVENVVQAADVIQQLENDSNSIGRILEVICGIAEQTNLLALNAAIEAARAGEQGRGFAVVADEVRTLALRTQEATNEIQNMIEKIQAGSQRAVSVMEQSRSMTQRSINQTELVSDSLQAITQAVNSIAEMTAHIAAAASEQSSVANEMASSINKISVVSESNATGALATADAGNQLSEQTARLQDVVGKFKV